MGFQRVRDHRLVSLVARQDGEGGGNGGGAGGGGGATGDETTRGGTSASATTTSREAETTADATTTEQTSQTQETTQQETSTATTTSELPTSTSNTEETTSETSTEATTTSQTSTSSTEEETSTSSSTSEEETTTARTTTRQRTSTSSSDTETSTSTTSTRATTTTAAATTSTSDDNGDDVTDSTALTSSYHSVVHTSPTGNITTHTVSASDGATKASSNLNTGAMAGGIAGGLVGLAILVFGILYFLRRRSRRRRAAEFDAAQFRQSTFGGPNIFTPRPPSMAERGHQFAPSVSSIGTNNAGRGAGVVDVAGTAGVGGYADLERESPVPATTAAHSSQPSKELRPRPQYTFGQVPTEGVSHDDTSENDGTGAYASEPQPLAAYDHTAYGGYAHPGDHQAYVAQDGYGQYAYDQQNATAQPNYYQQHPYSAGPPPAAM